MQEIGEPLLWDEHPQAKNSKCSKISLLNAKMNPKDKRSWATQHKWMLESIDKFRTVFNSRLRSMDVGEWEPEEAGEEEF